MRKEQIETVEISDAELDNVSGGVLNGEVGGLMSSVGGVMSSVGGNVGDIANGGNGSGNVNVGGVDLGGVSGVLGDL